MRRILLFLFLPFLGYSQVPGDVLRHLGQIDTTRIRGHVAYLSDNRLQGRKPGTPGYQMAVDYVTGQFADMGLVPAGENGTWLQPVYLRKSRLNASDAAVKFSDGTQKTLAFGEDVIVYPHPEKKEISIDAPLVFVGAGLDAPSLGYDDYKNIDVKGKVVILLRRTLDHLPANYKLHLQYAATLQEFAAKHGAAGLLVCTYASNKVLFKASGTNIQLNGINAALSKDGRRVSCSSHFGGPIQLAGSLSVQALQQIMDAEGVRLDSLWQALEKGQYVSRALKTRIQASVSSRFEDIVSYNVAAKLEGSDAKRKKEYVIHSAHLDHLGIGKPVAGDSIYNGAHDNASGVACALEIARMYATLKKRPARSLVFLFVTAEEMGLLGSGYFNAFPTVSPIVADVNTDMPTLLTPLESIAPLGAEHSSLMKVVEQAASLAHLQVEPDPDPAEGRFVRSDQYNFVKAGIPALHIKYGYAKGTPGLAEKVKVWREAHYHKPSDELNDSFVWSAAQKYVEVNFLTSYLIAQNSKRPSWKKGDLFAVKK
ncbi:M20/M25/M40 family metallo-hydrolase [Siphonobacter aquaeclarae]|uniref:Peptidase family M28 n=1 Tax=Siphonobacter aquaeclarae TaxID=563176 RepID=A0A1G9PMA5_9BACT|nr:M20/M25/M40 family metallo-hydrolase [Siphonobacter aquaeclarae]SDL99946.1 Peptidase family M28 [Siphonobacter aquaeclarae]